MNDMRQFAHFMVYSPPFGRAKKRLFRYNDWIPMSSLPHKAQVDSQGNIILPGSLKPVQREPEVRITREEEVQPMEEGVWYAPQAEPASAFSWDTSVNDSEPAVTFQEEFIEEELPEEEAVRTIERAAPSLIIRETTEQVWSAMREEVTRVTSNVIDEGARQYRASLEDGTRVGAESVKTFSSAATNLWSFLKQPVWVPGKKSKPVQHSRGVLFMLDTVRFGGTFAGLFTMLFVGLNYQSFWSIAQSYVDPLAQVTGVKTAGSELDKSVADKLKKIPSLAVAGESQGSLIDYLPSVGPPDNRLIIPKLNLNVPIVIPPNTALMREDWKALEEDIQKSLQDGVVHYPGTAKPGQAGNFFVTGHSSYFPWDPGQYKSVFARLHNLNVGDEYWVFYNGDRHRYVIQSEKEIKPSDVTVLDQPSGKRISTLMTCTPVGTTLRRLILIAQEVDPITGLALEVGQHAKEQANPNLKMEALPI
jgi:LPXTG-site transpeptidase (sortase) family protein